MKLRATPIPLRNIIRLSPLSVTRALTQNSTSDLVLLHSGSETGKSILGFDPLITLCIDNHGAPRISRGSFICKQFQIQRGHPLLCLEALITQLPFESPDPLVGWLGFVSYDVARFIEQLPTRANDDLCWPLAIFTLFQHYVLFDGAEAIGAFALGESEDASDHWITDMRIPERTSPAAVAEIVSQQSRDHFEAGIQHVKEYITAGDIYQANLAQRWQVHSNLPPFEVFERLCQFSPAPYAAFLRFHDGITRRHVASASPELFLQNSGRNTITRPIKGTRPRDLANAGRDAALREQLLASTKDHAELTMIVDLLRNDLGRVSEFGTVKVLDPRALEQHPTVWHTVATIAARLRGDAGLAEILAAMCPGGSITGAPKIRAMQIIEELELTRRGLYCGNIGVIGRERMSLNIAIRTILFQKDLAYVHAGAGIVADSDPAREYEETLHKAAAMFRALGL